MAEYTSYFDLKPISQDEKEIVRAWVKQNVIGGRGNKKIWQITNNSHSTHIHFKYWRDAIAFLVKWGFIIKTMNIKTSKKYKHVESFNGSHRKAVPIVKWLNASLGSHEWSLSVSSHWRVNGGTEHEWVFHLKTDSARMAFEMLRPR